MSRIVALFDGKAATELPRLTQYRMLLAIQHLVRRARTAPQRARIEHSLRQLVKGNRLKKVLEQVAVLWRTLGLDELPVPISPTEPFVGMEEWPKPLLDLAWAVSKIADPRSQEPLGIPAASVETRSREAGAVHFPRLYAHLREEAQAKPLVRLLEAKPSSSTKLGRGNRGDLMSDRVVGEMIARYVEAGVLHPGFDPFKPPKRDPDAVEAVTNLEKLLEPNVGPSGRNQLISAILSATGFPPPTETTEWSPESVARYLGPARGKRRRVRPAASR